MAVEVSIICNTYNHEKYISRAIEGFINQVTSFKYEILIHDDASTDNTQSIIREYYRKYPDIIKPIFQNENKYSKGISINQVYQFPRAKGKYIAICEGDDYWTDAEKLQKQYDILENYKEIDMCAHAAEQIDDRTGKTIKFVRPADCNRVLTLREVVKGGGSYLPTASLFFRKEIEQNPPQFRRAYAIDYTLQVSGAMKGGVYYINDVMSAYRYLTPESFTLTLRKDHKKKLDHKRKMRIALKLMNRETGFKYKRIINKYLFENYKRSFVLFFLAFFQKFKRTK